jgi:hypothetical protein
VPTITDNFNNRDFWPKENLSYAGPNSRARKCARMIAEFSGNKPCDLLDVGCGPAALRQVLKPNINHHGIDLAIHNPAPCLREVDFAENPIASDNKQFRFVVAMGAFEYTGRHQEQKFAEIDKIRSRTVSSSCRMLISGTSGERYTTCTTMSNPSRRCEAAWRRRSPSIGIFRSVTIGGISSPARTHCRLFR